ncbi:MAG: Myo-inositol 2-dehydrogenase [uncultured Thermomicrobiales bacterium]|uniref:Myo-inositol 2-dehydrogenase n=1 Tax=uncultured Thermomicrobiales bacterium TaxID=1645740 RepID=A0A6J4TUU9_9BACT|nr:MAG: Myo-inositol 2-dehydrogenase [uncultured Thermomicrobiales bacterium]
MPENERRLGIGVLGCGPIAQAAHLDAVRRARNADLAAICDVAPDLLARMAAIHEPRTTYTDYDAMLADPAVGGVIVATADQFHVAHALRAVQAGKPVLVEKPLGVAVEEAEALRAAAEAAAVRVQVGTMKRFDPGIAFARRFVEESLGQRLAMKAWYGDGTARYAMTDNLQPVIVSSGAARRPEGDPKADRPRYLLLGHGSHLVDTTRFLGGPIAAVRARRIERFGAWCWFVEVAFADGAVGHLDLTVAVRGDWREGFSVDGEFGSVVAKTFNPWFLRASEVECFSLRDGQYHRPLGEDAHVYRLQVEAFAGAVLDGTPSHGADAADGVAAVRALVAIARSVDSDDWVRLADATGGV